MISQEDIKTKKAEELVRSGYTVEDIIDAVMEYCEVLEQRLDAVSLTPKS